MIGIQFDERFWRLPVADRLEGNYLDFLFRFSLHLKLIFMTLISIDYICAQI